MGLNRIIKLFKQGNVCVYGLRGTGKDMLTANVVARRRQPYISNMNYVAKRSLYIPLSFDKLDVKNNYNSLISDDIVPYEYPYPDGCDIYISDCGVYFPSQYCGRLDNDYKNFPVFQALSRHLGDCNFHINTQALGRVWNKIREQSDTYILCNWCKVFRNLVFQSVTVYEKYDAAENKVLPYVHNRPPFMASSEVRAQYLARDNDAYNAYLNKYGKVKKILLIYVNKSKYDTRLFKKILGGVKK